MISKPHRISVRLSARALVLAAFGWCLFGENSVEELTATVVFAVATSVALELVRSRTAAAPSLSWTGVAMFFRRVPANLLPDFGRLLVALGRGHGVHQPYRSVPFHVHRRTAGERARRAIVLAGISTAPNTVALGIDVRRGEVIVHQLAAAPLPSDPEWPL